MPRFHWISRVVFAASLAVVLAPQAVQPAARTLGKAILLKKSLSLAEVLKNPEKHKDQKLLLEGKISDVCQLKGCWLMLSEGDRSIRIKFEGYSFFVPKDSRGKKARVEGRLLRETLSEEIARHYAEEQSVKTDLSQIRGPRRVVTFEASGVEILD